MESLGIKVGISGTYWGTRKPQYSISLNGQEFYAGVIQKDSQQVEYVEIDYPVVDGGKYQLEIRLLNKIPKIDVVKDPQGNIIKDFLLNVDYLEIDGIDISGLRHSASKYILDQPQEYQGQTVSEIKNCVNLGFNGVYVVEFTVPFYLWLLDNI